MHTPHNDSNNKQLTRVLQKIHIIYKIHDIESERRNVPKERSKVGFLTNHLCNLNCLEKSISVFSLLKFNN